MEENTSFGRWLKRRRRSLDLTQEDLARQSGYSVSAIRKVEADMLRPSKQLAERLAPCLDLAPEQRPRFLRFARDGTRGEGATLAGDRSQLPPPPPARGPHNLPMSPNSLIGREAESKVARDLLLREDVRLLTLTGPPGVGKTRLGVHLAAKMLHHFADGAGFISLASLTDPDLVASTIARTLGIRDVGARLPTESLVEHLQDRAVLLVLDNCEHLVDACAEIAEALLSACPGVQILATSRTALGIAAEVRYRVPPLAIPPNNASEPADALRRYGAVELFVERAQAVQPGFTLDQHNGPAVVEICKRVDGLPLAIELAAARVRVLTVDQIAALLDDRFRLLTGGSRTVVRRQQTLRALVDWSYDLLTESEQTLLRRLAVFVGGWTLEAAEAVCGDVLDLLTSLVDKSLVDVDQKGEQARYRLLETIRKFAQEKLFASDEANVIRDRHRDWFLAVAERGSVELEGSDQAAWLVRLEGEHDNLRAALDRCQADAVGAERQLRLAGALGRFWHLRGYLREGRSRLETALARPGPTSPRARALALNWAGNLERYGQNAARGKELLEEGVALARAAGDQRLLSQTTRHLAIAMINLGEVARARSILEDGLIVSRESGSQREIAWQLTALAVALDAEGAIDAGERLLEESLVVGRASGDATALVTALHALGVRALARGDYDRGRAFLEESLTVATQVGIAMSATSSLLYLGILARLEGDLTEGRRWVRELLTAAEAGFENALSSGLLLGGSINVASGRYRPAVRLFSAAGAAGGLQQSPSPEEWAGWLGSLPDDFSHPWLRSLYAEELATARSRLGEEEFAHAWAEGQALTLEQAITYALRDDRDAETT